MSVSKAIEQIGLPESAQIIGNARIENRIGVDQAIQFNIPGPQILNLLGNNPTDEKIENIMNDLQERGLTVESAQLAQILVHRVCSKAIQPLTAPDFLEANINEIQEYIYNLILNGQISEAIDHSKSLKKLFINKYAGVEEERYLEKIETLFLEENFDELRAMDVPEGEKGKELIEEIVTTLLEQREYTLAAEFLKNQKEVSKNQKSETKAVNLNDIVEEWIKGNSPIEDIIYLHVLLRVDRGEMQEAAEVCENVCNINGANLENILIAILEDKDYMLASKVLRSQEEDKGKSTIKKMSIKEILKKAKKEDILGIEAIQVHMLELVEDGQMQAAAEICESLYKFKDTYVEEKSKEGHGKKKKRTKRKAQLEWRKDCSMSTTSVFSVFDDHYGHPEFFRSFYERVMVDEFFYETEGYLDVWKNNVDKRSTVPEYLNDKEYSEAKMQEKFHEIKALERRNTYLTEKKQNEKRALEKRPDASIRYHEQRLDLLRNHKEFGHVVEYIIREFLDQLGIFEEVLLSSHQEDVFLGVDIFVKLKTEEWVGIDVTTTSNENVLAQKEHRSKLKIRPRNLERLLIKRGDLRANHSLDNIRCVVLPLNGELWHEITKKFIEMAKNGNIARMQSLYKYFAQRGKSKTLPSVSEFQKSIEEKIAA